MRVCVFGLRAFPQNEGGVENHCERLYSLARDDVELLIIRRKPYVKSNAQYSNIKFIDLPSTKIRGLETIIHSFFATRIAIKISPDVVHIHNIGASLFAKALFKKRIPIIMTFHSANYEHDKWGNFAKRILRLCENRALKYSSRIIFINRFQMSKYNKDVKDKSVYIPNGVDPAIFPKESSLLARYGIVPGKYVLGVGRVTPEKGFDTLIKAFNKLKLDDYKLIIAGGLEYEKKYYLMLKKLSSEKVIFTGTLNKESLIQLYANTSLFVLPSRNEGFPLVLLEAMSLGADVLTSDIPACHLIDLNEEDYFKCDDAEMLAQKIMEKVKTPRRRQYDLKEFSWESIAQKTIDEYYKAWRKH